MSSSVRVESAERAVSVVRRVVVGFMVAGGLLEEGGKSVSRSGADFGLVGAVKERWMEVEAEVVLL